MGGQPAARGLAAPARDNVVPIRSTSTTQLVPKLIGGEDPYVDRILNRVPDITPGMPGDHFLFGLVPQEEEISGVQEMQGTLVRPLNETVNDDGDIGDGAGRASRRPIALDDKSGSGAA